MTASVQKKCLRWSKLHFRMSEGKVQKSYIYVWWLSFGFVLEISTTVERLEQRTPTGPWPNSSNYWHFASHASFTPLPLPHTRGFLWVGVGIFKAMPDISFHPDKDIKIITLISKVSLTEFVVGNQNYITQREVYSACDKSKILFAKYQFSQALKILKLLSAVRSLELSKTRPMDSYMSQRLRVSGQSRGRWQRAHCRTQVIPMVFKVTEPSGAKPSWTPVLCWSSLRKGQLFRIGTISNSEMKGLQTDT